VKHFALYELGKIKASGVADTLRILKSQPVLRALREQTNILAHKRNKLVFNPSKYKEEAYNEVLNSLHKAINGGDAAAFPLDRHLEAPLNTANAFNRDQVFFAASDVLKSLERARNAYKGQISAPISGRTESLLRKLTTPTQARSLDDIASFYIKNFPQDLPQKGIFPSVRLLHPKTGRPLMGTHISSKDTNRFAHLPYGPDTNYNRDSLFKALSLLSERSL
jgi:hypothetical protein